MSNARELGDFGAVVTVDDGNVGIGTSSPNVPLEVAGDIHVSGADRSIFNRSDNALTLGTNNTERMRIDSAGNVGIGTSSPEARLHVVGDVITSSFQRQSFGLNLLTTDEWVITVNTGNFHGHTVSFMASFGSTTENTRRGFAVNAILRYAQSPVVGTATVSAGYNVTSDGFSVVRLDNATHEFIIKHQGSFGYSAAYSNFSIQSTRAFTIVSVTSRAKT